MFYFKDDNQVTVYFANGDVATWKVDNPKFEQIVDLCLQNKWIQIETIHNQAKIIMTSDKVAIDKDGNLTYTDDEGTMKLTTDPLVEMIQLLQKKGVLGTNIEPIKPFLKNILENPYINATHEIYEYCKNMDFEITTDGCFLAYKNVRSDLGSIHDGGKTKHAIGKVTKVEHFDTNRNNDCSYGLHFCSKGYLRRYSGDVTIIVKVNPKHVCSIPTDYSFQKGRCTQYIMVGYMGKDGSLQTTNLEEATNEKIVKTPEKAKADKKLAQHKGSDRITETANNMKLYKNDIMKVAKVMHLSPETVKRNMRKFKSR